MKALELLATILGCSSASRLKSAAVLDPKCASICETPLSNQEEVKNCLETMTKEWRVGCRNISIGLTWEDSDGDFCPGSSTTAGRFQTPFRDVYNFMNSLDGIEHTQLTVDLGYSNFPECSHQAEYFGVPPGVKPCADDQQSLDADVQINSQSDEVIVSRQYDGDAFYYVGLLGLWAKPQCAPILPPSGIPTAYINVTAQLSLQPPSPSYRDLKLTFSKSCRSSCGFLFDLESLRDCMESHDIFPVCAFFSVNRTIDNARSEGCGSDPINPVLDLGSSLFHEANVIIRRYDMVTYLTDVRFAWQAVGDCEKPELWFAEKCDTSTEQDLRLEQMEPEGSKLHFIGKNLLPSTVNQDHLRFLKVVFPDKKGSCQPERIDAERDLVTMITYSEA